MATFKEENGALIRRHETETTIIEPYGKNALRVICSANGRFKDELFALLPRERENAQITINEQDAQIVNGNARATVDKNGKITFYNQNNDLILEEYYRLVPLKIVGKEFKPTLLGKHKITMRFEADPNEKIFGMGQYQQSFLNLKGCTLELAHRNSQASVPFYVSSKGYGFLWNVPAIGEVTFGKNITKWTAEMGDEIDYLLIIDDEPSKIMESYADITGKSPMMPEYAMGFWQSKLRYRTQDEVMEIARGYKERGIPLSVIVIDFFHWPHQGDFRFDYDYFPDPEKMVKELREMGTELMVSVWPTIEFGSENYKHMLENGYLIKNDRGLPNHTFFVWPAVFYDTTNPEARKFVWETIKKNYYSKGIKIFWLDEAEPEYLLYDFDNHRYHMGHCAEVGNIYPLTYSQNFYEGMASEGQENIINLVRCAWAGSQRYGALVWSGDIMPTFEALNDQVRAGLNMAMSGIPWWTTDIGGFDSGVPAEDDYKELVIRWFEYATFCPVLRMHGYRLPYIPAEEGLKGGGQCYTGSPNEIWSYGDKAYEVMKEHIFLRERLRPYIRELMKETHEIGTPSMRPLFYDFPSDEKCWDIDTEYMFGSDLLVAPILALGERKRDVYLPNGEIWQEVLSGKEYKGGQTVSVDAPIEAIPLFIRKGGRLQREIFIKD